MTDKGTGKHQNSKEWTKGAFALTRPSDMAADIICIDDCDNCPLFKKGCAGKCSRWDDLVCSGCPCLGSKYQDRDEIVTVDPDTLEEEPMDPKLILIRDKRKHMADGEKLRWKDDG